MKRKNLKAIHLACAGLTVASSLLIASTASAFDVRTWSFQNNSGAARHDLHVTLTGTGGNLVAVVLQSPPGCNHPPTIGYTGGNTANIVWTPALCIAVGDKALIRFQTNAGPLDVNSAIWTPGNVPLNIPNDVEPGLNHYLCRQVKDLKVPAKFGSVAGVTVSDQTGNDTCEAKKPFLLCDPVDTDSEGIANPNLHYCCYKLKCTQKPAANYEVTDQFWNGSISTKKPKFLCNPCQNALAP